MNHDICFTAENAEYVCDQWIRIRGRNVFCTVFYAVGSLDALNGGEDALLSLKPVQVVVQEESPVGCNACDLGDVTLLHHDDCPVHYLADFLIRFFGEVTYAP